MLDLDALRDAIQSGDWTTALAAADQFAHLDGDEVLPMLLPLLHAPHSYTRNAVALALRDLGDNRAVEPLLRAIKEPIDPHNRGTLMYALEALDCSCHFRACFDLVVTDNFEVQEHALTILLTQVFWYSHKDLEDAQAQLLAYEECTHGETYASRLCVVLTELLDDLRA